VRGGEAEVRSSGTGPEKEKRERGNF